MAANKDLGFDSENKDQNIEPDLTTPAEGQNDPVSGGVTETPTEILVNHPSSESSKENATLPFDSETTSSLNSDDSTGPIDGITEVLDSETQVMSTIESSPDVLNESNIANVNSDTEDDKTSTDSSEKKRPRIVQWFLNLKLGFKIAIGAFVALCIAALITCIIWLQDLPDYSDADAFNTIKPTKVYASDRETLLARFQLENRIPLESLDSISLYAVEGTVATEDERFYDHAGVDLIGIARALINNLTGGTLEGASTITQQLVRNTVLADEMNDITIKRKVREAFLALQMENLYSKEDILLLYMNTINYGGGAYGIEAAAQRYYSKSASELTLNEAATLVGIPQSPSYNNPLYYPENAEKRRNVVLDRMVSYGAITQEEADAVKAEPIVLNPTEPKVDGFIKYPYFGSYVRDELLNSYDFSTEDVFKGGMTVYTTLDVDMQNVADKVVDDQEKVLNKNLSVALVATDPDNGYIKCMVGGKDFYKNQWNLATQGARQAGSSFKTFTLVAALEQGISPQTTVNCSSTVAGNGWEVSNSGNAEYGNRSIAGAFAVSSNTGFMRVCLAVGPENVADTAHRMGIKSDLDIVPTLTLGVSSVTPLEMSNAYATIANGGTHYEPVAIEQVIDRDGNVIIDNTNPEGTRAISPEVAYAATNVMKGVVTGGTGTRAKITTGQPVAGKTGTSEHSKDSWFVGITPQYSVAVWIGDPKNKSSVYGLNGAAVWGKFMNKWMADKEIEQFPKANNPSYTKHFSNTDLDVPALTSTKDPNEAPDLKGMTVAEALKLLKGYKYSQSEEFSDDVPAGQVIGQRVEGEKLIVIVSKGKDPAKQEPTEPETPTTPSAPSTPSTGGEGSGGNGGSGTGDGSGSTGGTGGSSSSGGNGDDTGNSGGSTTTTGTASVSETEAASAE